MKAATLLSFAAQVVYVFSMPAPMENGVETTSLEDRETETADILFKRGTCFYKKYPNFGDTTCSKSGWCYDHCNLQGKDNGEWCWHAYNNGDGDWVKCKSNADCTIARNLPWPKSPNCRGSCKCE